MKGDVSSIGEDSVVETCMGDLLVGDKIFFTVKGKDHAYIVDRVAPVDDHNSNFDFIKVGTGSPFNGYTYASEGQVWKSITTIDPNEIANAKAQLMELLDA